MGQKKDVNYLIEINLGEFVNATREGIIDLSKRISAREMGDILRYFDYDHHPRYLDGWNLIAKHCDPVEGLDVLEAGTPFPFFTYPFAVKYGWNVKAFTIEVNKNYIIKNSNCYVTYGNLCTDDLGSSIYDIVVTTEVLEHLMCNLKKVVDRILRSLKPGGLWLVSFPMGGMNASQYENDLISLDEQYHPELYNWGAPHRREFTLNSIGELLQDDLPIKLLDSIDSHPPAYFHIVQRLYRKV